MRKFLGGIAVIAVAATVAIPSVASAAPQGYTLNGYGPDATTVGQSGCFGQWRAASGQAIKQQTGSYAGVTVNGVAADSLGDVLSARAKGEFQNTPDVTNVADKATCGQ